MSDGPEIGFRRLEHRDLPLIHRWLHTPHVARWWYEDVGTCEEVAKQYSAYIEGREPVEPYLILYWGSPIGYIQSYLVADDEEYDRLIGIRNSAGVDLFIGERELLYKGFGPRIIRRFLAEAVFADEEVETCVIDPEPKNSAAIRAYEKAGFRYVKTIQHSEEPEPAYLMALTREEFRLDTTE